MKTLVSALALLGFLCPLYAQKTVKPVAFISGDGSITITTTGGVVGAQHWAVGSNTATVSKHDQTMEMAQNLIKHCAGITTTLDASASPDYYLILNRGPEFLGRAVSQIMALNRQQSPIHVAKETTVKTAVIGACKAILADWNSQAKKETLPKEEKP